MQCDAQQRTGVLFIPNYPVLKYSYYTQAENIKAVLSDGKIVKGIEMTGQAQWKKLIPEKGGMSYFEQEAERLGGGNDLCKIRLSINQRLFLQFPEDADGIVEAKKEAIACCNLVFVHFFDNGVTIIQGIEIDMKAQGGFTCTKIFSTRLDVLKIWYEPANVWRVEGIAASFAPRTSLTAADLEAL